MKHLLALFGVFALSVTPVIGQTIPYGSYQSSCTNIEVSGGTLRARCRDSRGTRQDTSIVIAQCAGRDIENDRGTLRCGAKRDNVPYGSYLGSCRQIEVHGSRLLAYCLESANKWAFAMLTLPCHGDIANNRGKLVCKR